MQWFTNLAALLSQNKRSMVMYLHETDESVEENVYVTVYVVVIDGPKLNIVSITFIQLYEGLVLFLYFDMKH